MDKGKEGMVKAVFVTSIGLFIVVAKSVELAIDSSIKVMVF